MKTEIINSKKVTFITGSECKLKSNKQLLNLLRTHDIRNIRECGCAQEGCQNRGGRGEMRAVLAVGKGHGFRYLCPAHYGLSGLEDYHSSADVTYIGTKKNTSLASTPVGCVSSAQHSQIMPIVDKRKTPLSRRNFQRGLLWGLTPSQNC